MIAFSVSPDGSTAASASLDRTVRLWSIEGEAVKDSKILWSGDATCLKYLHKGNVLALGFPDGVVRFLELPSGKIVRTIENLGAPIRDLAFTDDDSWLGVTGAGNVVHVFDLKRNTPVKKLELQTEPVSLAWSHDGKALAVGLANTKIEIWSWPGRERLAENRPTQHSGPWHPTTSLFFDPTDAKLVSIHRGNQAYAWYRETGVIACTIAGPNESNMWLDVAPDFSAFAMVNGDGALYLCESALNLDYTRQPGHPLGPIYGLGFLRDGNVVTCSRDRVVHFRDGIDKNEPNLENRLLVESTNRSLLKWNTANGAEEPYLVDEGRRKGVYQAMASSADGEQLAFKTWGGRIEIREASSGKLQLPLFHTEKDKALWIKWDAVYSRTTGRDPSFNEGNATLAFSYEGKLLASLAADGSIVIWDLAAPKLLDVPEFKRKASSIAFSPTHTLLAIGDGEKVQIWNYRSLQLVREIGELSETARSMLFAPDGASLAIAHAPRGLTIISRDPSKKRIQIVGGEKPVGCFAFSHDGGLIAATSEDGKAHVWTLEKKDGNGALSIDPILEVDLPRMTARVIAFSPDDQILACGGEVEEGRGDVYFFKTKRSD